MNYSYKNDVYANFTSSPTIFPKNETDQLSVSDWVGVFLYILVIILGVPGNGLVIWITAFDIKRSVNTMWFLNLAVADLLCCLFMPFTIMSLTLGHWPLGFYTCKVIPPIASITMFASILLLTMISIDRCLLVVKPVWCQNNRTLGKAYVACAVIWTLAIVFNIPSFIFWDINQSKKKDKCVYNYRIIRDKGDQRMEYSITICGLLTAFILPLLVMVTCYTILIIRVRKRFTQRTKIMKVVLVVIVGFFICWLPYHVTGMIAVLNPEDSFTYKFHLDEIFIAFAFMNNCINPIIYVVMGQDMKDRAKKSIRIILRNVLEEEASQSRESRMKRLFGESRNTETSV
ncbi:hypothetical protein GDO81_005553 [Engystomops pustulosus]|uniref:C5a anaphylatoxin chemotactic receptor 1 n=1 Tax=Engystomops pustulosus TaxID=76066 RepID=A0AAV7CRA3_ENGPU|nr:hypothetical protein GDO81_005553 [Engystomops pustulosus]